MIFTHKLFIYHLFSSIYQHAIFLYYFFFELKQFLFDKLLKKQNDSFYCSCEQICTMKNGFVNASPLHTNLRLKKQLWFN